MRVVVTGAAGFIGSHLCGALVGRGHEVVGIDGFTRFYARELKERNVAELRRVPGFTLCEGNLRGRSDGPSWGRTGSRVATAWSSSRCGTSRCTGRASAPTWRSPGSSRRP
jgi:nucleoside-diphosphate-sugar epimerase